MFRYAKKLFIAALLHGILMLTGWMPINVLRAQQSTAVQFNAKDSLIDTHNEDLVDVTFELVNTRATRFNGALHVYVPGTLKIVNKDHIPLRLEPGERKYVSVKVYVSARAAAGLQHCYAQLFGNNNTMLADASVSLRVASRRDVRIILPQPEIVMPQRGEDLDLPVLLSNKGNDSQTVTIVLAYPASLEDGANASLLFKLPEFSDTLIHFKRTVTAALRRLNDISVNVTVVYANGDFAGSRALLVQQLRSRKSGRVSVNNAYHYGLENSITLGVQNLGGAGEAYFARSNGNYRLGEGRLSYNLNVLKWNNTDLPTQINNTWLSFERNGLGVRLGNLNRIGEINLNGRGIEAYYQDSAGKNGFTAGLVDKSYNLIGTGTADFSLGTAAFLSANNSGTHRRTTSALIYDDDLYYQAKSLIWLGESEWHLGERLIVGARTGLAQTRADNARSSTKGSIMLGAAITGYITDRLSIYSDNYYSSGYFPGTRRGSAFLNERLTYHLRKTALYLSYNHNSYQPKFLNSGMASLFGTETRTHNAEIGLIQQIGPSLSATVAPVGYRETGSWKNFSGFEDKGMQAIRINTLLNWNSTVLRQSLAIRIEAGQFKAGAMEEYKAQYRGSINWSFGMLRLSAIAQKGLFLLAESFRQDITPATYYRYSLSPMISKSLWKQKLQLEAGLNFYKDNQIANATYLANIRYDYRNFRFFGNLQYSRFNNVTSYNNVMLGITRILPQTGSSDKSGNNALSVFAFRDYNSNGLFDNGDSVSIDDWLYVNRVLFVTDKKGNINYKKLPDGAYNVRSAGMPGWYAEEQDIVLRQGEKKNLIIAWQQTGTVMGKIAFAKEDNSDLNYPVAKDRSARTIAAVRDDGKTIVTKTNDEGQYVLYLPSGNYTLSVIDLPNQIEYSGAYPELDIKSGKTITGIDFELRVRQRKVEVKKFGTQ